MATQRGPRAVRRVLPWLGAWMAFQAVVAVAGRLAARRWDEGDDSTASIRRVQTLGGFELHPTNPELCRVRLDLGMAGGELDLTGLRDTAGIDLTVNVVMGGLGVRVPPDWRVWSHFRGIGGVGTDGGIQRTADEHGADLRVHARAVFGGIGIEAG
jgi:hypothetical protein